MGVAGHDLIRRAHSASGRRLRALTSARLFLSARRRSLDARVGFVARRGVGGVSAERRTCARRSRAAARLRRWERFSEAVTVRTLPVSRSPSSPQGALALAIVQRTRRAQIQAQLHPRIRRIDALPAGTRRVRKALDQLPRGHDEAVRAAGPSGNAQIVHAL